ncbi:ER membrane protein complex subunit 5 [Elgaria multicarinata webbii]|uniref:ER membrane protein complex subunit 5 n=1 Tax=Elgaria multicarinata webbii TaxID=159646 RepID=UPI002FCD3F00
MVRVSRRMKMSRLALSCRWLASAAFSDTISSSRATGRAPGDRDSACAPDPERAPSPAIANSSSPSSRCCWGHSGRPGDPPWRPQRHHRRGSGSSWAKAPPTSARAGRHRPSVTPSQRAERLRLFLSHPTPSFSSRSRLSPPCACAAPAVAEGGGRMMAAASLWKGLVGVGLFALAHAAFSAAQHRSYMRLTEKEDETLPIDIVLQTLLAFAVTCYGIVHIAGEFKDMDATSELKNKTFDTLRNHPSFYVFNHRGRVLFQSPDTVHSSSNQDALSSSASLKLRKLEPLRR